MTLSMLSMNVVLFLSRLLITERIGMVVQFSR